MQMIVMIDGSPLENTVDWVAKTGIFKLSSHRKKSLEVAGTISEILVITDENLTHLARKKVGRYMTLI